MIGKPWDRREVSHMHGIDPYRNEADVVEIGDFTVENRTDRVSLYGSLDLTRDKEGLTHARSLRALIDKVIGALEADRNLPDKIPPSEKPETVKNPFN